MTSFNQILHILRKDVRHLYPEITVSFSLVALFAWIAPAGWPGYLTKMPYPGVQFGMPGMIAGLLHVLIPLSWLILISRVVHDESLVGDRQFWVTRPFTWYSLLAAKAIFIASFLCLPLLLAQIFLVHYAGLPVLASLPALLGNVGCFALFFLLPFTVLAAVTTSFGPLILIVLGGLLYLGLVGLLGSYLHGLSALPPYALPGAELLLGIMLTGILVYQYIARKTGLSQILLLASPVAMISVLLVTPAGMLFHHVYPRGTTASAGMDLDPTHQQSTVGPPLIVLNSMLLSLPVAYTGVPDGMQLEGTALQAELTSSSGYHWTSPWESIGGVVLSGTGLSGTGFRGIDVRVPVAVVQRIGNETVRVRLTLAIERIHAGSPVVFPLEETDHAVPGGVCSLEGEAGFTQPVCRYVLKAPMTAVETVAQDEMCPLDGSTPTKTGSPARATLGTHNLLFALDPVLAEGIRLQVIGDTDGQPHMHTICAGVPMHVTPGEPAGRERIEVEQTGIELTPYLRHQAGHVQSDFGPGQPPR